jgi:ribosome-binding protein aMBF1 (putative translation factor)
MKYYTWDDHKKELMKNKAFKKAYDSLELEYSIASALIKVRIKRGLSQAQVAKKMKTTQSVISRVESAQTTPSVTFLKRLAVALDIPLRISLG